jgi:phosphodiesterase/alkaline phosphatase D-like protein
MPFLIVPNEVTSTEAIVWLGVIDQPVTDLSQLTLRANEVDVPIPANWTTHTTASGNNQVHYQYLTITGLQPRTDYVLEIFRTAEPIVSARVQTLPDRLPMLGERPFTVLLASCFSSSKQDSSQIGNTYTQLRIQDRPDVKFLCGDQVYLDDPALHFTFNTHSPAELEDILFANYVSTWTQTGSGNGNQRFLQQGANFFTSDDHEFWNNAPNWATLIPDTYTQNGRDEWWSVASSFLKIFQTEKSITRFEIEGLSFYLQDTRVNRGPGTGDFISQQDLEELEGWVKGLSSLGVLVIGQPIFSAKAGFFSSKFGDKNLPNYKQYEALARILSKTQQSLIVLTGDVHYGRIAYCQPSPNVYLYEIISSPTALVNPAVGGKWHPPPELFPAFGVKDVVNSAITTEAFQLTKNHFLTLAFFRDGATIRVVVKAIEIVSDGQAPSPVQVADLRF